MRNVTVASVQELEQAIVTDAGDALYRGQVRHFGAATEPSFQTSFDRHGCFPPEMLKWSHFAKDVLNHWFKGFDASKDFSQAVLQHYGWRSFYLDASQNPAVSAWFASHSFHSDVRVQMCEDYEERPAWLRKMHACAVRGRTRRRPPLRAR